MAKWLSILMFLLEIGIYILPIRGQQITPLNMWTEDAFRSKPSSKVLVTQTAIDGSNGLHAKISLTCRREDKDGHTLPSSFVDFQFVFSKPGIKTREVVSTVNVPHTDHQFSMCPFGPGGAWVPCSEPVTTYTQETRTDYFVDSRERFENRDAINHTDSVGSPNVTEWYVTHNIESFESSDDQLIDQYLYGFEVAHGEFAFRFPTRQPAVAKFLLACKTLSASQEAFIKEAVAKKEAAAKAEEVRLAKEHENQEQHDKFFAFMKISPAIKPPITTGSQGEQEMSFQTTSAAYAFQRDSGDLMEKIRAGYNHCGLEEKYCAAYTDSKATGNAGGEIHLPSGIRCNVPLGPDWGPAEIIDGEPYILAECIHVPINGGGYFPSLSLLLRPGSLQ